MENKLTVLPNEVRELAVKVSESKQAEVQTVLQQIFTGTDDWERQVDEIEVKSINDTMSIQLADVARLNSKKARLSAEKIFDSKRNEVQNLKAEFDLEDKLWLKAKQVMQLKFKAIEEKAEWKANFAKRYEAEQKELRTQQRILSVSKYAEINRIEFENMSDDSFESFINGLKSTHEAKIEAERLAEELRIAKAKAEAERIEAQRLENIKLKKEAEERERLAQIEANKRAQIEAERVAKEAIEAKERAEKERKERESYEAKIKAERNERERIESELKAKKDAELKAENARLEAERLAKIEADKLAKAPIKNQLNLWVDSFAYGIPPTDNEATKLIIEKFEAFKKWAKSEINNL
jgi:colicin import membrane protein